MPTMARSNQSGEYLPTRASLLNRLKNPEDDSSWEEFVQTYRDLIFGVAVKSGLTNAEAEDVAQETLISVAKYVKEFKYDPTRSFKAWLLKITRTRIADQYQFRKRLPGSPKDSEDPNQSTRTDTIERIPDSNFDLAENWNKEWRQHVLKVVLQRLRNSAKPKHYEIFEAYVIKGWSVEKVAATLKVTPDLVYQVKSRLTAAIQRETSRLEFCGI
jgi:RNA polymerase sigma-70 factor (ECF subfamily)